MSTCNAIKKVLLKIPKYWLKWDWLWKGKEFKVVFRYYCSAFLVPSHTVLMEESIFGSHFFQQPQIAAIPQKRVVKFHIQSEVGKKKKFLFCISHFLVLHPPTSKSSLSNLCLTEEATWQHAVLYNTAGKHAEIRSIMKHATLEATIA